MLCLKYFQTVFGTREYESVTDDICNKLFEHDLDFYFEEEFWQDGEFIYYPPPLDGVFLDETKRRYQKYKL